MNRILTTILATAIGLTALTAAFATQHGGSLGDHFSAIARHLGLSTSQEKQLKEQHLIAKKKLDAIDADKKLDAKARAKAKEQLHNEMLAGAKKVLTTEQFKKLSAMHRAKQVEVHLHAMLQKLDLSSEQTAKIKDLVHGASAAMHQVESDPGLTDAQKGERAKQLHTETLHKIHALLTPAQQLEFQKMVHGG